MTATHPPDDRDSDRRALDEVVQTNHQLAAELATARRDAAADALDDAARRIRRIWAHTAGSEQCARYFDALARTTRSGTRPVPGSPQPAPDGGEESDSTRGVQLMSAADGLPPVSGRCPACHGAALFMTGQGITCAWSNCPDPYAAETADMAAGSGEEAER